MKKDLWERQGGALIFVLWLCAVLSLLVVGLSRRAALEAALSGYAGEKSKSEYAAWSGVFYAADLIRQDSEDGSSKQKDTIRECGWRLPSGKSLRDIFAAVPVGDGHFEIQYPDDESPTGKVRYGFRDEEGKINLNALNPNNDQVLIQLLLVLGTDAETARTIAASVLDWKDEDDDVTDSVYGAEDSEYMALKGYHCKNRPFENLEELLLVKGMTPEIFNRLRDFVTVFPKKQAGLSINPNTASAPVLKALTGFAGSRINAGTSDADQLAEKILRYRRGADGLDGTEDDREVNERELSLTPAETALWSMIRPSLTGVSRYFRVRVRGTGPAADIATGIEAVIFRNDLSIVYWRKD